MTNALKFNLTLMACTMISSGIAKAESQMVVQVTPIAIENKDHSLPDHLLCFTSAWKQSDPELYGKLLTLQAEAPAAFTHSSGGNICSNPEALTENQKTEFNEVLNFIQAKSNQQVALTVPEKAAPLFPTRSIQRLVTGPTYAPGSIILRNEDRPIGRKILRSMAFTQGTQLASLGILLIVPRSISKWPEKPLADAALNLKRAYTRPPVWDHDDWAINYIGHPLSGGIYYNMLRSQGATPMQSFLYSTAQSVFWEYTIEAVAEQPSIQDLLFTSTIGSIMGELEHQATLKMARNGFNFGEKALMIILNPSYLLNNGFKVKRRPIMD